MQEIFDVATFWFLNRESQICKFSFKLSTRNSQNKRRPFPFIVAAGREVSSSVGEGGGKMQFNVQKKSRIFLQSDIGIRTPNWKSIFQSIYYIFFFTTEGRYYAC